MLAGFGKVEQELQEFNPGQRLTSHDLDAVDQTTGRRVVTLELLNAPQRRGSLRSYGVPGSRAVCRLPSRLHER